MLTIFVMYSNDRRRQLEYTVSCLADMEHYEKCEKLLVVDDVLEGSPPPGWQVLTVPRQGNPFCWAKMWNAGVLNATNEKILYLDSDRLLPRHYLSLVNEFVADRRFVFTSLHFMIDDATMSLEACKRFLAEYEPKILLDPDFMGRLQFEQRYREPSHGPGKNVMSGNTAFTRSTYCQLGGVDSFYEGHGAYADTDFHYLAFRKGCEFVDLAVPEMHCHHHKVDDSNAPSNPVHLQRMGLDNFIYYCCKWRLPLSLCRKLAIACNIPNPDHYVRDRMRVVFPYRESNETPVDGEE